MTDKRLQALLDLAEAEKAATEKAAAEAIQYVSDRIYNGVRRPSPAQVAAYREAAERLKSRKLPPVPPESPEPPEMKGLGILCGRWTKP